MQTRFSRISIGFMDFRIHMDSGGCQKSPVLYLYFWKSPVFFNLYYQAEDCAPMCFCCVPQPHLAPFPTGDLPLAPDCATALRLTQFHVSLVLLLHGSVHSTLFGRCDFFEFRWCPCYRYTVSMWHVRMRVWWLKACLHMVCWCYLRPLTLIGKIYRRK